MKSAEEYYSEIIKEGCFNSEANIEIVKELEYIKAIQLDAWKQGMMDAASLCEEGAEFFASVNLERAVIVCTELKRNLEINIKAKTSI